MGVLTEQIQNLGYQFIEGRPLRSVPQGDAFREIFELRVRARNGQEIAIKCDDSPTMFPAPVLQHAGANDAALMEDVTTTCGAVYRDYYDLDDNAYTLLLYNYSSRTKAYLDAEKARIGLIDYKEGLPEGFFALDKYPVGQGIGEVDVGRYADGRFVAQTSQALFEDAYVLRMHFTHFPSRQDVEDTLTIRKIARDFKLGRHREMFVCGDCGEIRHWLDIGGNIQRKLFLRLRRKCGCAE